VFRPRAILRFLSNIIKRYEGSCSWSKKLEGCYQYVTIDIYEGIVYFKINLLYLK
jgi:hypothetical protein